MSDTLHVHPLGDVIEHRTDGQDCPCEPETIPVERPDGSFGWIISHNRVGEDADAAQRP